VKEFKCGDVVPGCPAVFEAETDGAIFDQIQEHARDEHGMDKVPPEVVEEIRARISERPA
jgi:predicted small metal-binding protein